jgi:hypothetical protein
VIRALTLRLGLAFGLFAGGFLVGRWGGRKAPVILQVGSTHPRAEQDLSPKAETRTVIVPKEVPGHPATPPVAVPPELGQQVSTTSTTLAPLPEGGTFHASTFTTMEGSALELHTVEWLDTPTGRASLGEAVTTTQPVTLRLPVHNVHQCWNTSALIAVHKRHVVPGVIIQWTRGPLVLNAGNLGGLSFVGAGISW